ncbi:cysteine hydrolase family protein [Dongia soli]|uniref:Isochorismatase family cysteine hydrolase n=1 Tax=Dongia soli TaxID=600628 RepID=A0ABU5EFT5_9PROT|nr:isochorismatase family cysteine hydrolase [Dongia soli]MDY0884970.1 isochorismatase family cysteine hydrolase [Dongia soli]
MSDLYRFGRPEDLGPAFREQAIDPQRTAIISVDMQNADCSAKVRNKARDDAEKTKYSYFHDRLTRLVIPNQQKIHAAARKLGMENIYVVIESLTRDGRDRGIDHKASFINNPRGSWQAAVIDEVAPAEDDIIIRKTASGPFGSTNLDYVLRNMGFQYLVIFGVLSDQCVENTVRGAADLGYLVTLVPDACATYTEERQSASERGIKGYCRIRSTEQLLSELSQLG